MDTVPFVYKNSLVIWPKAAFATALIHPALRAQKMNERSIRRVVAACGLAALLSACGGGSDITAPPPPSTDVASNVDKQNTFIADYTKGLMVINTYVGLTSASFLDLFDVSFLDGGNTKPLLGASFAQEAMAMAASPDLPSFPMAALSTASISACDSSNVCTLTGTLSNNDVDTSADNTTAITFTTRVKYSDGKFRLLGDGTAS